MRAVLLVAALVSLAGSALAEERVLFCTETASVGFKWVEGQTEGRPTGFNLGHFTMKVLSETKRQIKDAGEGFFWTLTCRKVSPNNKPELIVCDYEHGNGTNPWAFNGNNFVKAFLEGPPVKGEDPNIFISYGTCSRF